jgi:hypothetical protein
VCLLCLLIILKKEKFPAQATWSIESSLLIVDWKKYGKYAFDVPDEANGITIKYSFNI